MPDSFPVSSYLQEVPARGRGSVQGSPGSRTDWMEVVTKG